MFLNGNDTGDSNSDYWNNTLPTDSVFSLGGAGGSWGTNGSGETYVAYLFADNSTEDAAEQMIKCGSYTATGDDDINLGWEPQFILSKRVNSAGDWEIHDTVRGLDWGAYRYLSPNTNQAESSSTGAYLFPTATGFTNKWFSGNDEIIYMAIRAPMMKEPESATEVFAVDSITSSISQSTSTFPVDFAIASAGTHYAMSRLTGTNVTATNSYGAEFDWGGGRPEFDLMDGISLSADMNGYLVHMFKRAKGFMDCVAYSGGITSRPHSLGVTPEFIIIKARNTSEDWVVWHKDSPLDNGSPKILKLNSNGNADWSPDIIPNSHTDTTFEVGGVAANQGGANLIAHLFASLDGVSKVGSYTGNGTSITINCGFSAGSRFILIKRTDASGDWYIWDTTRGIVAGNDPHLSLNTTVAEVTTDDSVDPDNSGFIVNQVGATNINVSSGTYIYLAIA